MCKEIKMTIYTKREEELMRQAFEEGVQIGLRDAEYAWRKEIGEEIAKVWQSTGEEYNDEYTYLDGLADASMIARNIK